MIDRRRGMQGFIRRDLNEGTLAIGARFVHFSGEVVEDGFAIGISVLFVSWD